MHALKDMPYTGAMTRPETRNRLVLWGLLALGFLLCYYPTFLWLHGKYGSQDSYYSHGYLIPLVSAYLIYLRRAELKAVPAGSSAAGLPLILLALAVHVFGVLGDINFVSGFSMVVYWLGCSLYLLGAQMTRVVLFPIFFLVFMCPIPDAFINVIAIPSKSLATSIALSIIDFMGIPYVREGFVVQLPQSTFVVGTPCNGMRSLISFAALGLLMLYLFRTSWLRKAVFLACIPLLALLLNGARIALLLWIAYRFGEESASPESYLHDGSGLLVFVLGCAAMMILLRKINARTNA